MRLFRDSITKESCLTAVVEDGFAGLLTIQVRGSEFYRFDPIRIMKNFPLRGPLIAANLLLFAKSVGPDEFHVDTLVVHPSFRSKGVGTALLERAEAVARDFRKTRLTLDVLGDNTGAIRLYQRMDYTAVRRERGFFVRLLTGSDEVLSMEKALSHP